jgi:hypothetical protein
MHVAARRRTAAEHAAHGTGTLLGHVFRFLPFSDSVRGQALLLACTLLGLGTLWFALPEATRHVFLDVAQNR